MIENFNGRLEDVLSASGLDQRAAASVLLERLTFGPRAGEIEQVVERGLAAWLDEQLSALSPEPELAQRLTDYPAAQLKAEEIVWRYPDLGKVYAHARHTYDLIPPRGAIQDFDWVKRKVDKFRVDQGYLDQDEVLYPELMGQKIVRACYARNQLAEVLSDFWFNHFYVSFTKFSARVWILPYERDAIRPRVLGRFRDLLGAVAHHPAMLSYLDNNQSVALENTPTTFQATLSRIRERGAVNGEEAEARIDRIMAALQRIEDEEQIILDKEFRPRAGINENYARELMELHTLGVDGGYSQADVSEVARALTGWTAPPYGCTPDWFKLGFDGAHDAGFIHEGYFLFRPDWHDATEKTVLGRRLPAGRGLEDGEDVLDILASHPSTARFISRKLATRFVADAPPAALVEAMAKVFLETGGDIRAVMESLLLSEAFWTIGAKRNKTKSPFLYAISAARALDVKLNQTKALADWVARMGQPPYGFKAPTGFPDRTSFWINSGSLLNRMSFGLSFALGRVDGVSLPDEMTTAANDASPAYAAALMVSGPAFQQH